MITMTRTKAPADLLGLGSAAVRAYPGVAVCPTAESVQGTGLPTGGTAVRRRPAFPLIGVAVDTQPGVQTLAHNSIGTTLGFHPSRRPQS